MQDHAALVVERSGLAEVIDPVEELRSGRMSGGDLGHFFLNCHPHRHRVNADGLPRQARHEHIRPVLVFNEGTEGVRDLEPPFVINFGGVIAPEHVFLLHFAPLISTAMVEKAGWVVNRKIR